MSKNNQRTDTYLKVFILFFIFCFGTFFPCLTFGQQSDRYYPLEKAKRILFLGNSITYDGRYVAMFESLLLNQQLEQFPDVINLGLPSETVSGLSEEGHANGAFPRPYLFDRLESILEKVHPDLVFVCYGMNDGIYLPFDKQRFKAYQRGMKKLYKKLLSEGAKRVIVLTPPVHDDKLLGLNGYNKVLDRYSEWLLQQRKRQGWEVVDLHFPMKEFLEDVRLSNPSYKLAKDGIHPDTEGHWLMAQEIVAYLYPDLLEFHSWNQYLDSKPKLERLYQYVREMQDISKKFWLSYTGHKRPGIPAGLSMIEADAEIQQLKVHISKLLTH